MLSNKELTNTTEKIQQKFKPIKCMSITSTISSELSYDIRLNIDKIVCLHFHQSYKLPYETLNFWSVDGY